MEQFCQTTAKNLEQAVGEAVEKALAIKLDKKMIMQ
jgi:hypothetical protein